MMRKVEGVKMFCDAHIYVTRYGVLDARELTCLRGVIYSSARFFFPSICIVFTSMCS